MTGKLLKDVKLMKKIFEEKYFFWDSDGYVQIEVEKATSEETVESINLKNGDYLITVKKISSDKKDLLTLSLPFSAKTDIRECLKSVHNIVCRYCDIDRWAEESEDIFSTFNYGINEVLSNIAKNEAKEKEVVKAPYDDPQFLEGHQPDKGEWVKRTDVLDKLEQSKKIISHLLACGYFDFKCEKVPIEKYVKQAAQFLKGENIILEDAQAGNSPFDADEVFNKEMKAYPEEKVK